MGGVFGGVFLLNPAGLFHLSRQPGRLRQTLVHELVHVLQRSRSKPEDMDRIDANDTAKLNRLGPREYYNQEPLEAMALAKNAYDAMIAAGVDPLEALRKGTASRYSPIPVDSRRFDKYLYQYATGQGVTEAKSSEEVKSRCDDKPELDLCLEAKVLPDVSATDGFDATGWLLQASGPEIKSLVESQFKLGGIQFDPEQTKAFLAGLGTAVK